MTNVEILNILDDHSRLLISSIAHLTVTGTDVVEDFQTGFERYGLPASVLTDNAAVFTGKPRGYGQVAFEKLLAGAAHRPAPLPSQPPPDLRQGRTVPPDRKEVA